MTRDQSPRMNADKDGIEINLRSESCVHPRSSSRHPRSVFFLLPAFCRPRSHTMPSISVVVPVRNEARSIERTLRSLLTQDFPPDQFEVIVADGFSADETVPVVRRLQGE